MRQLYKLYLPPAYVPGASSVKNMLPISQTPHRAGDDVGEPADERIFAALDLGTNNCRLLVASVDVRDNGIPFIRVHDSFSRIVRLGEGVGQTGMLSHGAMERTTQALKACQKKLSKYSISDARYVATEACRRAGNAEDFLQQIHRDTGLDIDIITTEEEARLAFMGCSSLLGGNVERAVVFDIGGGSTELMWVDTKNMHDAGGEPVIKSWLSMEYGVMNLADRFGGSDFAEVAFEDMVTMLRERLATFEAENNITAVLDSVPMQLLSTSGTVTTLAAIFMDLPRYDRSRVDGITLDVSDIRATIRKLLAMRPSERFNHPCIGPDRADFIISGCAIFEAISSMWPMKKITIADRGVREGIILTLLQQAS